MQMQFEIYQWLVPLVSAFYLSRTILQLVQDKRSLPSGLLWIFLWVTIIVLAVIPNPVSVKIASLMGFKSNINAIIFVALGWLFLLVFYLSSSIDRLERQLTTLVRRIAIAETGKAEGDAPSSRSANPGVAGSTPASARRRQRALNMARKNLVHRIPSTPRRRP